MIALLVAFAHTGAATTSSTLRGAETDSGLVTREFLEYQTARLSDEQVRAIRGFVGDVNVLGPRTLTDDEADALASVKGRVLVTTESLMDSVARRLSTHRGLLVVRNLTTMSERAARHLGDHRGGLSLPDCHELSAAAISHLSQGNLHGLELGLRTVTKDHAGALAQYKGTLTLASVSRVDQDAGEPLRAFRGRLRVTVGALDVGGAQALAKVSGTTTVTLGRPGNEPVVITNHIAEHLVGVNGPLQFMKVDIDPGDESSAEILATHPFDLTFWQWQPSIPLPVIAALGKRSGRLQLNLSGGAEPDVVRRLCEFDGDLRLGWPPHSSSETAAALATHRRGSLVITGVRQLSEPVAAALSQHRGPLRLEGENCLAEPNAVAALCRHAGSLALPASLVREDTIESVLEHEGSLRITYDINDDGSQPRVREFIQAELFQKLARYPGALYLDGPLTMAMATALAGRRGDLVLFELPKEDAIVRSLLERDGRSFFVELDVRSPTAALFFASDKNQSPTCTSYSLVGRAASEIATIMIRRKGEMSFSRLKYISADALRVLATRDDVFLPPLDTMYILSEDGAEIPAHEVVSDRFLKINVDSPCMDALPAWHFHYWNTWDRLVSAGVTCPP